MRKKLIGYYFLAIFCGLIVFSYFYFNLIKNLATQYFIATIFATLLSLPIAWFASNIVIENYLKINWRPTRLGRISGGILGLIYTSIILISLEQRWVNSNGISYGINISLYLVCLTLIIGISSGIVVGIYAATIGFISILVSIVTGSIIGAFSFGVTGVVMSIGSSFLGNCSLFAILIASKTIFYKKTKQPAIVSFSSENKLSSEIKFLLDLATRENNILTKTKVVRELEISPEVADEISKYAELNSLCQSYLDEENGSVKYKFDC
ncbi:hypothetical protein STA3757_02710 [Stanieria sp. NIES-3757]|nr:hypothetical protein STA3757_02710 [Stanieria sp. NIES-3757]